MIILTLDQDSTVVLTLSEKALEDNPIYLFEFINQNSNDKIYFTTTDVSAYIERYNEFVINLSNIAIGSWDYNVYEGIEVLNSILTEYDVTDLNLLEKGKVWIISSTVEEDVVYETTITEKVFENE
jgi:hypothetical protein